MAKRFLKRRLLVPLGLVLLLLIACWCVYVHYHLRTILRVSSARDDLSEISEAFYTFLEIHHRWPHTVEEIQGLESSEGTITWTYKDPISGLPYRCVTDRGLYDPVDGARIVVMQPRPYRTHLWPFGDTRIIVGTYWGVHDMHPSEIIDAGEKQNFEGEFPDRIDPKTGQKIYLFGSKRSDRVRNEALP
ncbi:MAG TPA: hypothetical protein DD670_10570 [Planctomycetaceae bacterium]|nr:hypothetical protein [Planctomycetaceae bacterium]